MQTYFTLGVQGGHTNDLISHFTPPHHILGNKLLAQMTISDRFASYTINYYHRFLSCSLRGGSGSVASGHPASSLLFLHARGCYMGSRLNPVSCDGVLPGN